MLIGLTGGIASGKSSVATVLSDLGAFVIDADAVSREVYLPGSLLFLAIVEAFGPTVLNARGELDRAALGRRVFGDPVALERLNGLTHPAIWKELVRQAEVALALHPVVVLMVPLLLEHGGQSKVDEVWVVSVPRSTQVERLTARDALSLAEAESRLAAQWPLERKLQLADVVIDNSGTAAQTRAQLEKVWRERI